MFVTGMTTDLRRIIRINRRIMRPFQSFQNFDVYPDRLVPKRDWVSDATATTNKLTRFVYADNVGGGYTLWGLGLDGSGHPLLLKKSTNPLTDAWLTPTNNVCANAAGILSNAWLFAYQGYLYFPSNGAISRYNIATATMTSNWQTISPTNTAMPVIHPRSGNAYFFFDTGVYRLDPSSNWVLAQQVPANMYITSGTHLGNNLAIGTAPLNNQSHSAVYLWDLGETTLPIANTFSETIDWGIGTLMHLANIHGYLVGVSNEYMDNATSINKGRMVSRVYSGSTAQETSYLTVDNTVSGPISASYFVDTEKLYFPAAHTFKGDARVGIWSLTQAGTFAIELTEPTTTSAQRFTSCFRLGAAWFIARNDNSVFRQNDQASFTNTSIVETAVYGNRFNGTQFFGSQVAFEPLTSGQSVMMKYRPVGTNTWTLMKTENKVGNTNLQAISTSIKQAPLLSEYQFRVESIGATITGITWETEAYDTNIYG